MLLASLVALIGQLLVRRRRDREDAERTGAAVDPPRTAEQKEGDRRSAVTWGCLLVAVPVLLVLLYTVTR